MTTVNPRGAVELSLIHGYPVRDIWTLIGTVFNESIPDANPLLDTMSKRQKHLTLKSLLVRVLKIAFQSRRRILVVVDVCSADASSAQVINDFIGSSEVAWGMITYHGKREQVRSFSQL
jgi:hypothetical protein